LPDEAKDGATVKVVEVSGSGLNPMRLYVDRGYRIVRQTYSTPGPDGRPAQAEELFSDYRKVNGIDVPFKASGPPQRAADSRTHAEERHLQHRRRPDAVSAAASIILRQMRIMISCGEPSGDLYAGALVSEILRRQPSADVFGFGGQHLAARVRVLIGDFHGLSVTGLTEAIGVLPRSFAMLRRLTAAARQRRPDVFVAIDFPDFNFRLMAALHRLGIPIVYYISPQLWAWRAGRMQTDEAVCRSGAGDLSVRGGVCIAAKAFRSNSSATRSSTSLACANRARHC
jgi:hypothetical protein